MTRQTIKTSDAPAAIGPYSQAIKAGQTVYLSGQIPLDPATGEVVEGDFETRVNRVFRQPGCGGRRLLAGRWTTSSSSISF
jgi:enamine deaminase RidA (YjgF/YER057c/UK114 family)